MKKALVLFIGFICYQIICHAQVMDESHYQNFYEFLIKSLNYLVIIYFMT